MKKIGAIVCLAIGLQALLSAQETEAFGFEGEEKNDSVFSMEIGGALAAGGAFFFNDFKTFQSVRPASLISGNLHIRATAPLTEAYFGVRLNDRALGITLGEQPSLRLPMRVQIPRWIDEAYLKIVLSKVVISGGIQKIHWGRADALTVLDIVNPRDMIDPTVSDAQDMKLARPLFAASVYFPHDIKFEGVFLPVFEGNHISADANSRWYARRLLSRLPSSPLMHTGVEDRSAALAYAQGGGRLTTSAGGIHDFGFQCFYGRLPDLAVNATGQEGDYNQYYHIGLDYGVGIGPVQLTAECAANITNDLTGDDPYTYNPFIAWNAGIDYGAPRGFHFKVNAAEKVRLLHGRIGSKADDIENALPVTGTALSLAVSQTLLRQSFEWKLGAVIGIEDADFYITPGIRWQLASLVLDCAIGIFGGSRTGSFGQFGDNSFVRLTARYAF